MKNLFLFLILFLTSLSSLATSKKDPHYNDAGFFDIHICNWPDRPPFFLTLFSTYKYDEVEKITLSNPQGKPIANLNLEKFRVTQTKKGEKRAFLNHIEIPQGSTDGWYEVETKFKNGNIFKAKDYVILDTLPKASGRMPSNDAEQISASKELSWKAVPGANFYQVFIRDFWNDEKIIYTSPLLDKPELTPPKGLLKAGGWYGWRVHARDTNEHVLLGDFNHGSLSSEFKFTVAE
ncbi:MAG: hypothetical protein OEX19_04775 [Gammaproteobacteria bacterium]|nr:hypothetical protein [Gammaproteobacteria bacterium]